MIELFIPLLPIITLTLGMFLVLGFYAEKFRQNLVVIFNAIALSANTLLIAYYNAPIDSNVLVINNSTFFVSELVLITGLIGSIFSKIKMNDIENAGLFDMLFLILEISAIGLFITSNLILIFIFAFILLASITLLFHFGKYPHEYFVIQDYMSVITVSAVFIFALVGYIYSITGDLSLNIIQTMDLSLTFSNKFIILILTLLGFGMPCGFLPVTIHSKKNFYEVSNVTSIYLMINIQYPTFSILIFRILSTFDVISLNSPSYDYSIYFSIIILILGTVGLVTSIMYSIFELTKKIRKDSRNIKIILGAQAIAQFNLSIIIFSINNLVSNSIPDANSLSIISLSLLIIFSMANNLLFSVLLCISNEKGYIDFFSINTVGKMKVLGIGLILIALFYSFPYLFGYKVTNDLISILISYINNDSTYFVTALFAISTVLIYILNTMVLIAIIFTVMFLSENKNIIADVQMKFDKKLYFPLIISTIFIIIISIIVITIPNIWNLYLSSIL